MRFLACLVVAIAGAGLAVGLQYLGSGQTTRGLFDCLVAVCLFAWGAGMVRHVDEA